MTTGGIDGWARAISVFEIHLFCILLGLLTSYFL